VMRCLLLESHPPRHGGAPALSPYRGMSDDLAPARATLQRYFGFDAFRGGQRDAVAAALTGRDVLVLMPTGGGKSHCYQMPALTTPRSRTRPGSRRGGSVCAPVPTAPDPPPNPAGRPRTAARRPPRGCRPLPQGRHSRWLPPPAWPRILRRAQWNSHPVL
jgi:hypothetical protein